MAQRDLAVSHVKLGDVALAAHRAAVAETSFRAALEIITRLAGDPPDPAQRLDLAEVSLKLARAGAADGRALERRALELLEGVAAEGHLTPEARGWLTDLREGRAARR
jgi:hypothetical protein